MKSVAPDVQVFTFADDVARREVDGRLINGTGVGWLSVAATDLLGDMAMYVPEEVTDEESVWNYNRQRGIGMMLVNDVHAAIAWRDGLR